MKLCQTLTKPSLDRYGVENKVVTKHFENGYKRGWKVKTVSVAHTLRFIFPKTQKHPVTLLGTYNGIVLIFL